jgi:hypothetical protein
VSGSNFDDPLYIGPPNFVASGPMDPTVTNVEKMYVWIVQIKNSETDHDAMCGKELTAAELRAATAAQRWETTVEDDEAENFGAGPALGFAAALVRDNVMPRKSRLIVWSEAVSLKDGAQPVGT